MAAKQLWIGAMQRRFVMLVIMAFLVGGAYLVYTALSADAQQETQSSLIGDNYELPRLGFETADDSYEFSFPEDHGPHSHYQRESWRLETEDDCDISLIADFRLINLLPETLTIERESEWAVESVMTGERRVEQNGDVLMNHIVDSRLALDLAGANASRVWIEAMTLDWENGEFLLRGVDERIDTTLALGEVVPLRLDDWVAYTRSGHITGTIEINKTDLSLDCPVTLTHRFGTP